MKRNIKLVFAAVGGYILGAAIVNNVPFWASVIIGFALVVYVIATDE